MRASVIASFAIGLALVAPGHPAHGEPVSVQSQGGDGGQGWVTRQGDQCIVITAKHVVVPEFPGARDDDRSVGGVIVGRGGIKGTFNRGTLHPELDLALLFVEGQLKAQCPNSSLGFDDSRPALGTAHLRRTELAMEIVEESDNTSATGNGRVRTIPVVVDTLDRGADHSEFLVATARPDIRFLGQGDSGAAIRDPRGGGVSAGEPLGLVIREGDQGSGETAHVLRFDLAKAFVLQTLRRDGVAARPPGDALPLSLVDWTGDLVDPACGPLNALAGTGCAMALQPASGARSVDLTVALPRRASVRTVDVSYSGPPVPFSVAIKSEASDSDWVPVRFCRPSEQTVRCATGGIAAAQMKITFNGVAHVQSLQVR